MATQLLKTIALRSSVIGAALGLVGVVFVSCGGSDLTCGPGTVKQGTRCIVSATTQPDAGDAGGTASTNTDGGGVMMNTPTVTFDGVTSVSPVTTTSLQVTWSPATASLTPVEQIVYNVYVGTAAGGENFKAPTAVSPPGATSIIVGNLEAKTKYFVVVRAMDQSGNMDTPDSPIELTAKTVADSTPPMFDGAKTATAVKGSGNSVTVSWDPAMDDLTAAAGITYEIFWSDSSTKGLLPSTLGTVTVPGASSGVIAHLPKPLSTYYFYVKARDAAGDEDDNQVVISGKTGADVTPPVFGGCVAVTNPGAASATLTWLPAEDDTSSPANITYNVYAVTDPVDDMTQFNLPNGSFTGVTTGIVQGLLPSTTYYFVCRAEDEASNEDTNISYRIATTLSDNKPPTFKGITNTVVAATSATLTWAAATDNETDPSQIQYIVYQDTNPNPAKSGTGTVINPGPELGATSVTISNLDSNTTYFWAVVAEDSAGNKAAPSADATGQTLVSFEGDVQPIFTTNCAKSGCHSNNAPMQGQDLSDGDAYSNIVGVPTRYPTEQNPDAPFNCQHMNRIEPGDPTKSFIVYKLEHSKELNGATACTAAQLSAPGPYPNPAGCCTCASCTSNQWFYGLGMPKDLCLTDATCPGLDPTIIAVVKTWITQGALDN